MVGASIEIMYSPTAKTLLGLRRLAHSRCVISPNPQRLMMPHSGGRHPASLRTQIADVRTRSHRLRVSFLWHTVRLHVTGPRFPPKRAATEDCSMCQIVGSTFSGDEGTGFKPVQGGSRLAPSVAWR